MSRYLGVLLACLTLHVSLPLLAQETPAHAINGILSPMGTVDLQQQPPTQNSAVPMPAQRVCVRFPECLPSSAVQRSRPR
jgi:hypothetical protein